MAASRARARTGRRFRARLLAAALPAFALLADPALAARLLAAKGAEAGGYGRLVLTFDKPVPVKAKVSGGVLVLTYGERAAAGPERLAEEMPAYLAGVRRDPDGTGLRLALQRPLRANVQAAGERVFVDLLPEGWQGLPPPLLPEVVAELARRAQVAEEALRARAPQPPRRALPLELARLPTLTRLSLRVPDEAATAVTAEGPATRLRIAGRWSIDDAQIRARPRPGLSKLAVEADEASASLLVTPAEGYLVRSEREDGTVTLDLVRRPPAPGRAEPAGEARGEARGEPKEEPKGEAGGDARAAAGAAREEVPQLRTGAGPGPEGLRTAMQPPDPAPAAPPAPPADAPPPRRRAGSGLLFPFGRLPPAALFTRGGVAVLAFETAEPVAAPAGSGEPRLLGEPARVGPLTVLRFAVPAGRLVDLAAVSGPAGPAWELSAGEALSPSATLDPVRRPDRAGRVSIAVALPRPGAAAWLDLDGERVAVVPSGAQTPVGNPRGRRFVDFEILPSRHGLAVLAGADDLAVRAELDGAVIGREGGLAASGTARRAEPTLAEAGALALGGEAWERARYGDVRETLRGLFAAAAAAPPAERGPARLALARADLANGFDAEGLATLEAAAADDPLLAAARETAILRGYALIRLGRAEEARKALAGPRLAADPEAALWRAMAAAGAGDWTAAETGFLKVLPLSERYPEDVALAIRAAAAESAIETGDVETAAARAAAGPHMPPLVRDRLALVRARVAEATGQTEAALDAYARLAEGAERPVAVEAALRGTLLARSSGRVEPDAAVERLERLALTWHGGPVAEAINAGIARLNLAAGRWRPAFAAVRRANAIAPDSLLSRALTAEAQAAFDDVYLGRGGAGLTGIEAVALYFDFRDLAPIGRRGDEVVRRLADRLVGLDLLDSAAELLRHQVEHRLTGPARAAVAARLATVELMDGRPMRALEAIERTDLPELPGELRRARALVRARALSDLTRTDLALEAIEGEAGPDVERLRADILWSARRWREAGEAHEALLGDGWRTGKPLDEAARADAVRAAIAYDLAGEAIGLERLKAKFSAPMAQSPDARTFALLTGNDPTRAPGFREIAARATKAETLSAFLAEYRKRYPEAAVPDRGSAGEGTGSRADAPAAAPPPG